MFSSIEQYVSAFQIVPCQGVTLVFV